MAGDRQKNYKKIIYNLLICEIGGLPDAQILDNKVAGLSFKLVHFYIKTRTKPKKQNISQSCLLYQ